MRIIIQDRNVQEELLKKKLHSVKMQLNFTINHKKLIKEEVTTLKKDFKQKENKYLEEFLDMKQLKEKVEDKLYKQDRSLQTVHMLCKPKPFYDKKKKVAIGYKNPLYLTKAKKVQPALYNGHELVKTKHAPAIVHDSEDTLEIAETTRIKMLKKSKSTMWVDSKIKIAPPDHSKENYLVTFTPQRQLTPEHIFWSSDIAKITLKPMSAMTVKTPCGLIEGERGFEQIKECYLAKVIPFFKTIKEHFEGIQKALVKEVKEMKEIFEQMESEVEQNVVDKQCAEIERKNLLIENENLIADCLSNELLYSVMNDVNTISRFFELLNAYTVEQARCLELEAEISKLKHKIQKDYHSDMIKHFSNLEIDHLNFQLKYQNLKERFGNNKSQPSQDTPKFNTVFEINRMKESLQGKDNTIRKLKGQISQMNKRRSETDRILDFKALDFQNTELTKKVTALQEQNERFRAENEKVKQHYKELYDSIKITRAKIIEKTTSLLTENEKLKAQLKGKMQCVTKPAVKPKVLALGMYALDVEPIPPRNRNNRKVHLDYLKHLKESVETLLKGDKKVATTPLNRNKEVAFREICDTSKNHTQIHVEQQKVQKTSVPVIPSTGVNSSTEASGSKPRSNTKNNKILPAKSDNKKKVEAYPRNNKSKLTQENCVDSSISSKRTVVQIVLWYLDSGCSNHMTGNRSRLRNFVKKFIGTVRFRNDHFGAIMGYGDYVIGDSVISRVYYVEGLGHGLFSVGQFCDSDLEVAFRKHLGYVRDVDGVELLKGSRGSNLYTISVEDMLKSSPICLLLKASKNKSWLWHRRLNHLNFDTINDLARKDLVKFFRSKDETPEFVIKFLKQIQVGLNKIVRYIRTDNGTEFVNQVLTEFYESVGIFHQKSVARTPQQNGVVERRNRTLVEAAWAMLIFLKASMFLWAETVATACYTQNKSLIHTRHNKTPYELVHDKKLDLKFL
ncbi:retrovirus-related pol polyprotein from transposon TNT 1-94 [Tanacetum coccineum]